MEQTVSQNKNTQEYVFENNDISDGILTVPNTGRVFAVIDESGRQYPFALDEIIYGAESTQVNLSAIMVYRNLTEIAGQWRIIFAGDNETEDGYHPDAAGPGSERNLYDDEEKGFAFLDTDSGIVYHKLSGAPADWSDGFSLRGEKGDTGAAGEAGPTGPQGDTGPQGNITAVVAAVPPVNPPDGMIWIEG